MGLTGIWPMLTDRPLHRPLFHQLPQIFYFFSNFGRRSLRKKNSDSSLFLTRLLLEFNKNFLKIRKKPNPLFGATMGRGGSTFRSGTCGALLGQSLQRPNYNFLLKSGPTLGSKLRLYFIGFLFLGCFLEERGLGGVLAFDKNRSGPQPPPSPLPYFDLVRNLIGQ